MLVPALAELPRPDAAPSRAVAEAPRQSPGQHQQLHRCWSRRPVSLGCSCQRQCGWVGEKHRKRLLVHAAGRQPAAIMLPSCCQQDRRAPCRPTAARGRSRRPSVWPRIWACRRLADGFIMCPLSGGLSRDARQLTARKGRYTWNGFCKRGNAARLQGTRVLAQLVLDVEFRCLRGKVLMGSLLAVSMDSLKFQVSNQRHRVQHNTLLASPAAGLPDPGQWHGIIRLLEQRAHACLCPQPGQSRTLLTKYRGAVRRSSQSNPRVGIMMA